MKLKNLKLDIIQDYEYNFENDNTALFGLSFGDIKVQIDIHNSSHIVEISNNETNLTILTEMVSNEKMDITEKSTRYEDFGYMQTSTQSINENIEYSFSPNILFLQDHDTKEKIAKYKNLVEKSNSKDFLVQEYINENVEIFIIVGLTSSNEIFIHAIHNYLKEDKVLLSKSSIVFKASSENKLFIDKTKFLTLLEEQKFSQNDIEIIQNQLLTSSTKKDFCLMSDDMLQDVKKSADEFMDFAKDKTYKVRQDIEKKLNSKEIKESFNDIKKGFLSLFEEIKK